MVVQLARFADGKRRITQVTEITGREGDTIVMQDLFIFKQAGIDDKGNVVGRLEPTGLVPSFADQFALSGVQLSDMGLGWTLEAVP
jgi:pilus assembly protein CpaF